MYAGRDDLNDADSQANNRAFAFRFEAGTAPFDPASSCFRPFCQFDPADPFIARERRNVLPRLQRFCVGGQCSFQVRGQVMDHTARDLFFAQSFAHKRIAGVRNVGEGRIRNFERTQSLLSPSCNAKHQNGPNDRRKAKSTGLVGVRQVALFCGGSSEVTFPKCSASSAVAAGTTGTITSGCRLPC